MTPVDLIRNLSVPGGIWGLLILLFAFINIKHLPGSWHIRLVGPLFRHYLFSKTRPCGPSSIFQPVICTSRAPLLECDYNLHKGNSSYFSDLDIARSHLLCCLLAKFLDTLRKPHKEDKVKGPFTLALGTVTCHFKRQILPYQKYEMWTRVLSWDEKWLYLVTHIVQAGKVKPTGYSLQPWRGTSSKRHTVEAGEQEKPHPAIFATSIARYVFKRGRWTIPPEVVLRAAEILPNEPIGLGASSAGSSSVDMTVGSAAAQRSGQKEVDSTPSLDHWDSNKIEDERIRGLRLAKMLAGLDDLHMEFTGETGPALAQY